jgi:hypothetical protein
MLTWKSRQRELAVWSGHGMVPFMGNIETVTMVLSGLALYVVAGFVFALAFVNTGIGRIDPSARGSGVAFRLAILPGAIALWPVMLIRWIIGGAPHGAASEQE